MISDKKLYLRRIGLLTPTVVEYGNQILVTNQLDMEKTCNMWRWYFQLPAFGNIDLYMTRHDFVVTRHDFVFTEQKTLASCKSVKEIFRDYGFICKQMTEEEENSGEWCVVRTRELKGETE